MALDSNWLDCMKLLVLGISLSTAAVMAAKKLNLYMKKTLYEHHI
jgi:hypothetical protein